MLSINESPYQVIVIVIVMLLTIIVWVNVKFDFDKNDEAIPINHAIGSTPLVSGFFSAMIIVLFNFSLP